MTTQHRLRTAVAAAATVTSAVLLLAGCTSGDQGSATQSPSTATVAPGPSVLPTVPTAPTPTDASPTPTYSSPAPTHASPTTPGSVPPAEGPTRPAGGTAPTGPAGSGPPSPTHGRFTTGDVDPALATVQVVPPSDPKRQAQLISSLCAKPIGNVQCIFTPSGSLEPVLGPSKLIGTLPACQPGWLALSTGDTTEISSTIGVTVSQSLGKIISAGIEFSFSVKTSTSYTTEVEDRMNLPEGMMGYAYRSAPMLRATGDLFIRETGAILPGTGSTAQWYAYRLPSVVFDTPDPSSTGAGAMAFVSRPMTPAEKSACGKGSRPSPSPER